MGTQESHVGSRPESPNSNTRKPSTTPCLSLRTCERRMLQRRRLKAELPHPALTRACSRGSSRPSPGMQDGTARRRAACHQASSDRVIPHLGVYSEEPKTYVRTDACTGTWHAAAFRIVEKLGGSHDALRWVNGSISCSVQTRQRSSALRRNELSSLGGPGRPRRASLRGSRLRTAACGRSPAL